MKRNKGRSSRAAGIKRKYGFHNSKSLGQNFLTDESVIDDIVEASGTGPGDLVIEIGPGMGVLTAAAAERAGRVIAVEVDKRLIPVLSETLADYDNIEIINADIMKTDLKKIIDENRPEAPDGSVRIMGNLPYYITTPILMKLLESRVPAETITIMMQKEVADRIMAEPGSRTYGALTVAVSYYCRANRIREVSRECFSPVPKVDSTVLRLDRRHSRPVEIKDEKLLFETVKAGFGKRRKTMANAMSGLRGLEKSDVSEILKRAGVEPSRRAETLSLEEFAAISDAVYDAVTARSGIPESPPAKAHDLAAEIHK